MVIAILIVSTIICRVKREKLFEKKCGADRARFFLDLNEVVMVISDMDDQENEIETEEGEDEERIDEVEYLEIISILRCRAVKLKRNSSISLFMIFITLCSGLYIFIYALQVTEIKTFIKEDERFETERLDQERSEKEVEEKKAGDERKRVLDRSARASGKLQSLNETQQFVVMIVNKVGALIILFFIVKLFVKLYRYNIVLSGYYDSRADILQIANKYKIKDLNTLAAFISPEKIDFGQTPQLPIEQATLLVKEVSSALKK